MLDDAKLDLVAQVGAALDALPDLDTRNVLSLAERIARKGSEEDYELALDTVQRWLSGRLHSGAGAGAHRLAPLVEVCEKLAKTAREVDVFNLDRRPLVLGLFDDLAEAIRRTA
jgi:DNA polymerase-3 subunit delta'